MKNMSITSLIKIIIGVLIVAFEIYILASASGIDTLSIVYKLPWTIVGILFIGSGLRKPKRVFGTQEDITQVSAKKSKGTLMTIGMAVLYCLPTILIFSDSKFHDLELAGLIPILFLGAIFIILLPLTLISLLIENTKTLTVINKVLHFVGISLLLISLLFYVGFMHSDVVFPLSGKLFWLKK